MLIGRFAVDLRYHQPRAGPHERRPMPEEALECVVAIEDEKAHAAETENHVEAPKVRRKAPRVRQFEARRFPQAGGPGRSHERIASLDFVIDGNELPAN